MYGKDIFPRGAKSSQGIVSSPLPSTAGQAPQLARAFTAARAALRLVLDLVNFTSRPDHATLKRANSIPPRESRYTSSSCYYKACPPCLFQFPVFPNATSAWLYRQVVSSSPGPLAYVGDKSLWFPNVQCQTSLAWSFQNLRAGLPLPTG